MTTLLSRWVMLAMPLVICAVLQAQDARVQDIPVPKEATEISYNKSRGDIRMKFPGDMKAAGEFYRAQLTQQQWTKPGKDNVQAKFWVQTFQKGKQELVVRTESRPGGSDIRVTPKGFLWDEDLAPRPEDIPIPENALELEYDDFFQRIEFKHKLSLKELVDFYSSKLPEKVWAKSGEDSVRDSSATLVRKSGKAKLTITIDAEDEASEVEIKTTGMSWDQIKLANTAMEKKQEKEEETAKKTKVPVRPSKPKKDIAKLEKLKSLGSVTIDGKKTELTEVFAYEVISYGTWRTHIVATARPVKQSLLLELLKNNVHEEDWGSKWQMPSPHVKLVLDADDSLRSMQLLASKVPGSSTAVKGEAVVEEGRARGKAKLSPQKFFEHTYEAEITFDVPLLTATTANTKKVLANVPKLEHVGKIVLGGTTYSLPHAIAYEVKDDDRIIKHVVLTEKALDPVKIRASLAKSNEVDLSLVGIQAQLDLRFNENDDLQSMFLWCDGNSVNWSGNENVSSDVQSEDDRIRGTTKTTTSEDVFGKKCDFQASFDLTLLKGGK
ncbi:MAG: hypothetical protein U0894_06680 [Pirellulales bacterium]